MAVLLNNPAEVGQMIYHAPKGEFARLAISKDLFEYMFKAVQTDNPTKIRVAGWLQRAEKVIGKRHELIHSNWGLDGANLAVARSEPPLVDAFKKAVSIDELERVIQNCRELITEISDGLAGVHKEMYS